MLELNDIYVLLSLWQYTLQSLAAYTTFKSDFHILRCVHVLFRILSFFNLKMPCNISCDAEKVVTVWKACVSPRILKNR